MALTKVSGGILDPGINVAGVVTATGFSGPFVGGGGINAGVVTATSLDLNGNGDISGNLVIGGNLTANGDFTTLNTTLREVEILRVDANTTAVAGIITQRGSGDIFSAYDTSTEVFKITDGGDVGIARSIFHLGDTNTDIGFPYNDAITAKTGGVQTVLLNSSGALIEGRIKQNNTNNTVFPTSWGAYAYTPYPHELELDNNQRGTEGSFAGMYFVAGADSDGSKVGTARISAVETGNYKADLVFSTRNSSFTEKVRIKADGNVGIGSAIPSVKLDVAGTIKTTNITSDSINLSIQNTADRILMKAANRIDIADNRVRFQSRDQSTILLDAVAGSSGFVKLYHNNNVVASVTMDALTVTGRTANSGMVEIASNQGANNNDRFRIHKTSAASRLTIQEYASGSWVENIRITAGGAVELKHADGTTKLETTSAGSKISGNLELSSTYPSLVWTDTNHNSDFRITNDDGKLIVYDTTRGAHVMDFLANGDVRIRNDKGLYFGESNDLLIGHDGSSTRIEDSYGYLGIKSNALELRSYTDSELYAKFTRNGAAELYHDNVAKLTTTGIGVSVIGEVAASQDYPNFRPTLDLNFVAFKKLDPRITYSRSGPASFVNEFGKVVLVGDNVPRFDHDPITRECKGLLIEESRTNIHPYSQDLSNWTVESGGSVTANTHISPAGDQTADSLNGTQGGSSAYKTFSLTSGTAYTFTVFLKYVSGNTNIQIQIGDSPFGGSSGRSSTTFNTSTGALVSNTGGTATVNDVVSYGNGWYRYSITRTPTSTANGFMDINHTSSTASTVAVWGAQIEAGSFATSYIPTTDATNVTRGYEATTLEGTDFSDVFGTEFKEFSLVADYDNTQTNDGTNYAIIDLWGESTGYDDRIEWFKDDASPYHIETRAFGQGNPMFNNGELSASSKAKSQRFATSWFVPDYSNTSSRRFVVSMGGEAVDIIPDNSGTTVPQITRMGIGCNPTRLDFSPGHLRFKRLMVYNKTLSDGQLQNLSAQ